MSKIYGIDVRFYGTAYIRADNEAEALEIAKEMKHTTFGDLPEGEFGDFIVSGLQFDNPDLPDVSLTPVMTCHGPDQDQEIECVHDEEE